MTPVVGRTYRLNRPILGNDKGTIGVVFNVYDLGEGPGAQLVFPNGQYDGFSPMEQELYLVPAGLCPEVENYRFTNVVQLGRDFADGRFAAAFR